MRRLSSFCAMLLVASCAGGTTTPAPSSPRGRPEKDALEQTQSGATVGESPPKFAVESFTTSGKLAVRPGQVTLVFFWATWNEPCKKSFPKLQELYVKLRVRGFDIAALSVDDESEGCAELNGWGDTCLRRGNVVAAAAKSWGAKFPVGWDNGHTIANAWRPSSMPTLYILDRQGIVRHIHHGWHDGEESALEAEILALL